jgi:hypothetical protein
MAPKKRVAKQKRSPVARRRHVPGDGPPDEAGPDEPAVFLAEMLADGAAAPPRCACLLSMAQLEAEEHVRLQNRGKLS